jgi:predicted DNA binding protein
MWIAKIKMKHDCLIGNRCKKFKIEATANELGSYSKGKTKISNSVHQLFGEEKQIQKFIKDLKKDKNILHLENKNNTIYISENKPETPVKKYTKNIFLASTVTIDKEGYEYWEIGSFNREDLNKFINDLEKISQEFELLQIKESTAENIFFPKVLPNLTDKQKIVIDLAIKEGYYKVPKKTSLRKLAKTMKTNLSTYSKHLQVAESKLIPDIFPKFN